MGSKESTFKSYFFTTFLLRFIEWHLPAFFITRKCFSLDQLMNALQRTTKREFRNDVLHKPKNVYNPCIVTESQAVQKSSMKVEFPC